MVNNYKLKNVKLVILIALILSTSALIIAAFFITDRVKIKYNVNDLINLSSLSDEFMNNYLENVQNIKAEDKDNILIITSKRKVSETYGAFNIIEAPNNQYILQYDSEVKKNDALKKFKKNKNIISVDENTVFTPDTTITDSYNSWGMVQLGYDKAINFTAPENLNPVTVAVVDTGVQMSEFNKYYSGRVDEVYDFFDPNTPIDELKDDKGHGTHVASTIAESTPSNVKILPVRMADAVKSNNKMYTNDIIAAINKITKYKMANVINMSLGSYGTTFPTAFYNAVTAANNENIICVASAGNSNISDPHYPSGFDNAISVAAVDSHLEKTYFSSYGDATAFAAPGFLVKGVTTDPEKTIKSGTSMAAPHVSGAVAILKSYNIDLNYDQTVSLLRKYAIDIGDDGWDKYYGYGVVNFIGATFCSENVDCDEYNVFAVDDNNTYSTIKIDAPKTYTPEYNYGNITNIMRAEIDLYYTEENYYTKNLAQVINNIEIIGYEPFSNTIQDVLIKYKNFDTILKVDNRNLKPGWNYQELDDSSIILTEMHYPDIEQANKTYVVNGYPLIIYTPKEIDGKTVTNLGDNLFLDRHFVKRFYINSGVKNIGKSTFGKSQVIEKAEPGPVEIIIPDTVEYIDAETFKNTKNFILRVYKDTEAHEYAINNKFNYTYIDSIEINGLQDDYKAYDKINVGDLEVIITYNGTNQSTEIIDNDYKIKYTDSNDSFRYGDTRFIISFDTDLGYHIEKEIAVTVNKAIPDVTIPDNLVATIGQSLSDIELPEGFKWLDDTIKLNNKGKNTFLGRYEPVDTLNYEVIDNIEIPVLVQGIIINPEFNMKDKIYNGLNDIPSECFVINNLNNSEYTVTNYVLSSIDAGQTTANVVLKLTDEKFKMYSFDGDVQEKEFIVDIVILPEVLIKPMLNVTNYTYNGENQTAQINNLNLEKMNITGNNRKDAGEQNIIISLKNKNYIWEDNTYEDVIIKFKIDKADPNIVYTSSSNTVEYDGTEHGINLAINSPNNVNIRYMDLNGEYSLEEMPKYTNIGEYIVKFRIFIDDNYTDIFKEEKINIIKATITNSSTDYEGFYDDFEHSININVNIDSYNIKYSVNNTNYDLDELPKFKDVGEYTINYKITSDNFNDLIGSNKVKIYGIKSFHPSVLVKDNILVFRENIFLNITNQINTYAISTEFKHFNKDNTLIDSDITKTGDVLNINLNGSRDYNYFISIRGDINSDGSISSADYVKIRKHIMETEFIKERIYFYAADINSDDKISSADYVKIRKYIMNGGGL